MMFMFAGCGRVDAVWACAGGWLWCGTLYHCPSCCWPLGSTRKMWTAVRGDYYDRKLVINVFCETLDGVFGIWGRVMLLSAFGFDQLQTFGPIADRDQRWRLLLFSCIKPASCTPSFSFLDGVLVFWVAQFFLSAFGFDQLQTEIRGNANCCPLAASLQAVHYTLRGWMQDERLWIMTQFWKMNQDCRIIVVLLQQACKLYTILWGTECRMKDYGFLEYESVMQDYDIWRELLSLCNKPTS